MSTPIQLAPGQKVIARRPLLVNGVQYAAGEEIPEATALPRGMNLVRTRLVEVVSAEGEAADEHVSGDRRRRRAKQRG